MNSIFRVFLFAAMLLPLSITSTGGEDISANYSFIILLPILVNFRFKKNRGAALYLSVLSFSGVFGFFINFFVIGLGWELILRQFTSLIIAMLPTIFLFCDLRKYYENFKIAVILCSSLYSILVLFNFVMQASVVGINPFVMKAALAEHVWDWPQRYILVLFAGFFFTFENSKSNSYLYLFFRVIILATIIVTFLRAAYLALALSLILFSISKRFLSKNTPHISSDVAVSHSGGKLKHLILIVLIGVLFLNTDMLEAVLQILDYLFSSFPILLGESGDVNVSDETRINIVNAIFNALAVSPFTGLGGAGVYVIAPEHGSSHNQYFDFLIRFGIIGLLFFLYFNLRILRYFWRTEPWVVAIISAYLVFGIAHETTKYSYGSVIFFFLLSLTYKKMTYRNVHDSLAKN